MQPIRRSHILWTKRSRANINSKQGSNKLVNHHHMCVLTLLIARYTAKAPAPEQHTANAPLRKLRLTYCWSRKPLGFHRLKHNTMCMVIERETCARGMHAHWKHHTGLQAVYERWMGQEST